MAALQSIRKRGALLVTIIAVALFLFVAGDLFRGLETIFRNDALKVGEVNGQSISIQDFQKISEDYTNFYELVQQKTSFSEDETNAMKDEAWQNYVQTQIIQAECEKLGIAVSDDEVSEVIQSGQSELLQLPIFMNQQTGRYDFNAITTFLADYKKMKEAGSRIPDEYEKIYKYYMFAQRQIRNQLLSTKYQVLLANVFKSNPAEAKLTFDSRATEADILLASFPVSNVKDDAVEVTDAEIKARYNENKSKYEQVVETRDLKVVLVQVEPSEADKQAAEKDVTEFADRMAEADNATKVANVVRQAGSETPYFDVFKTKRAYPVMEDALDSIAIGTVSKTAYSPETGTYYAFKVLAKTTEPDSVLFRQMAVVGKDEADIAKKADSIMNVLSTGAKFADVAKKFNQTGDSAWIATSQFENAAIDADNVKYINTLYGMKAGENKKLKLDNGATIILQVMKTANPVQKYKVASVIKRLRFSDDTYNEAYNKFSSFVAENKTIEQIEANAPQNGYVVRPLEDAVKTAHNIAGVRGTRDALKWAFDDAKVGDVSQLYECGANDRLMLVALTGINKIGYRSLDKMKDQITEEIKNEKKIDELCKAAENVKSITAAKNLGAVIDTISHVSFANPTSVLSVGASEPLIGATAVKTSVNTVSAPIKGNAGLYILQVLKKNLTSEVYDEKVEEDRLSNTAFRNAMGLIMNDLMRNANVVDNRYKFL